MEQEIADFVRKYWWCILLGWYIIDKVIKHYDNKKLEVIDDENDEQIIYDNDLGEDNSKINEYDNEVQKNNTKSEISYLIEKIRKNIRNQCLMEGKDNGDYYFKDSIWKSDISIYVTNPGKFNQINNIRGLAHYAIENNTEWVYTRIINLHDFDSSYNDVKQFFETESGKVLRLSVTSEGSLEKFKEQYPERWELLKDS